jgi:glycosyltransferase involved in cell wall biosynthesis
MKILHVEGGKKLYGGARQVLWLLKGLKEKGVENLLLCPKDAVIAQEASDFAHVFTVSFRGDWDITLVPSIYQIMRRQKADIVHIHSRRGADSFALLGAFLAQRPIVLTRRVDNPEPLWLVKKKYALVDHVVAISQTIQTLLIQEGVNPGKISLVHSAVEPYHSKLDQASFYARFNLQKHHIPIGVVAQLIPRKGHHYLIDAIPTVLARFPGARFLFFGQGSEEENLKQKVQAKGIGHAVIFAGFHANVRDFLPHLTLLVHPALMEGLGVALLEAALAGVPIVASHAGGIPEVVAHEENGLLVPPGDSHALAESIIALLSNPQQRESFGSNGQRRAREQFSVEAMVEGNLRVYETIMTQALARNKRHPKE